MALKITKDKRTRYWDVVNKRVTDVISQRKLLLKRDESQKDVFLKSRGIWDEYVELQKLEEKCKELRNVIQSTLGTCSSIDHVINNHVDNIIACDPIIIDLKKQSRQWSERITLAKDLNELDEILNETNSLFEENS